MHAGICRQGEGPPGQWHNTSRRAAGNLHASSEPAGTGPNWVGRGSMRAWRPGRGALHGESQGLAFADGGLDHQDPTACLGKDSEDKPDVHPQWPGVGPGREGLQ